MSSSPTKEELQIAAQHALIERLRVSEKQYSDLVNGITSVVFTINRHGKITFVNDSWTKVSGYTKKELIGESPCSFLVNPDTNLPIESAALLPDEEEVDKECRCKVITKCGEARWFNYSAQLDTTTDKINGIMHDVTQEVLLEKERSALVQARNNFFSGMSHELRTPLNGTILTSELIRDSSEGEISNYAELIVNSSKHLLSLIDDILDYSKVEASQLSLHSSTFSPREAIENTANIFSALCKKKGIRLHIAIDDGIPEYVSSDIKRLKQILNNLLSNATKFTQDGEIVLQARAEERDSKKMLICSVKDTGIGIQEDKIPLVFTPFKQADDSIQHEFGGTGLGLSLTKELVELMGGTIHLESVYGSGTTFFFSICYETPEDNVANISNKKTRRFDNSGISVLIVEDDIVTSMVLSERLIKHHGFDRDQVVVAASGEEMRQNFDGQFDIIIMDCNLPDSDGASLMSEFRENVKKRKYIEPYVVFATASTGDREAEMIEKSLPNWKAIKPITDEKLASLIQDYYSRHNKKIKY